MIPLTQKFIGNGDGGTVPGDCTRTAIASLLELDVELVPHFALFSDGNWSNAFYHWLDGNDYKLTVYSDHKGIRLWYKSLGAKAHKMDKAPDDVDLIASGDSPNGPWGHVVIWRVGQGLVWDVHPNPQGLASEPWEFWKIEK